MKQFVFMSALFASTLATPAALTTGLPASCTFKPTQTLLQTTGCPTACTTTALGIADAAITLACGCSSMTVEPTTVYTCPSSPDCVEMSTGWGIAVITPTTCATATPLSTVATATPTTGRRPHDGNGDHCGPPGHW